MPVADDLFGVAYLDAESFRYNADLFGVGMALADYPAGNEGNKKLAKVLQAASRAVDAFCAREFTPENRSETHRLDRMTWRFSVNNPPISSIVSCAIRYGTDATIALDVWRVFVNNQEGYCEITRDLGGETFVAETLQSISAPQIEIVYKSLQNVPKAVALATGYQAAHMINNGFVDKTMPPNFGKLDLGGLSVNNKKGYRSAEEMRSGALSAEAERLLSTYRKFSAA